MANPELVRKLSPATKKGILVTEAKQGQLATSELVDLADLLATDPADRATMTQAALDALVAGGMPAGRVADLRKAFATSSGASTPTPAAPPVAPPPGPPAVPTSQAAADALARSAASQQTRPVQPAFKVPFDDEPSITTRAEEAGTTESAIMEWSDLQNELQKAAESEQAPPPQEPPATPEPPAPPAPKAPKAPAPLRGAAAQLMKQQPPPAEPPPPPPAAPPQEIKRSSTAPVIRRDTLHFGNEPTGMGAAQVDGNRPVVLVADDDNRIRMVFRMKLEQKGFRVVEAEDGAEAWKRLQQGGISAAVLDMKMPGLHGLEVLQRLSDGKQELPVVVCTAYDNLDDEFVVATYPKLRYLTKPIDADQLAATLADLLAEGNA